MSAHVFTHSTRMRLMALAVIAAEVGLIGGGRLASPGFAATARDVTPDTLTDKPREVAGGRTVGVVIDLHNRDRAFALAENGGVFGSTDGGRSWVSNKLADGSPGPIGRGLNRGLALFYAIAMDPFDSQNLLVLAGDDNRTLGSLGGIWRSTNGGGDFALATNGSPPCRVDFGGATGRIKFSPDTPGLVFATAPCRLGMSTDAGASWSWISLISDEPNAPLDDFDVYPAGSGTTMIVACARPFDVGSGIRSRSVVFYPVGAVSGIAYPVPGSHQAGNCTVAFNPNDPTDIFVATGKGGSWRAAISEGQRSLGDVTWTSLWAPNVANGNGNGRPAQVAVHRNGDGVRVYFHNTTYYLYEDCPAHGACPRGPTSGPLASPDKCPDDPAQPWRCLDIFHADLTEIAFDPDVADACPLLIAGDGGISRARNCGVLPGGGGLPGPNSDPSSVGLHALQAYEAGFSGQASATRMMLALQDNGVQYSYDGGASWAIYDCGDGFQVDILGNSLWRHCNSYYNYNPNLSTPSDTTFGLPLPPNTLFDMWYGWKGQFINENELLVPTIMTTGALQFERFDPESKTWVDHGEPSPATLGSFVPGCCGDLAISNRRHDEPPYRVAFLLLPPQPAGGPHRLLCDNFYPGDSWHPASGLVDPVRVWASDGDPQWAYAYDQNPGTRGLYVNRGVSSACAWTRDDLASALATGSGEFKSVGDPQGAVAHSDIQVTAVGFDPDRPGRAVIGTLHAGVLVTQDYGKSWAVSHAFPEPNSGATGFYFDDSGAPDDPIGETYVASWGRGVWAVRFSTSSLTISGIPRAPELPGSGFDTEKGSSLHFDATLVDEALHGLAGQHLQLVIDGPQGHMEISPQRATGANGVAAIACIGDCSADSSVTVNELITMVGIALGEADTATCAVGDANHDGKITVDEILTAVNNALGQCPPELRIPLPAGDYTLMAQVPGDADRPALFSQAKLVVTDGTMRPQPQAVCGNAFVEDGEICDGNCPTSCPQVGCLLQVLQGPGTCTARCVTIGTQSACISGDGCCPVHCSAANDDDCPVACSNTSTPCVSDDGCCPPGCAVETDHDCAAVCGDGIASPSEECDGSDLRDRSCQDFGLAGGTLACSALCTFDTSGCSVAAACGNQRCESGETCSTCPQDCGSCCGNGVIDPQEQCDGADLGGHTCQNFNFPGGILTCDASCTFDLSHCIQ